jgi:hypothetical protein
MESFAMNTVVKLIYIRALRKGDFIKHELNQMLSILVLAKRIWRTK